MRNNGGAGIGTSAPKSFLPFEEALEFARSLNLKGCKEWWEWRSSGARPANIPSEPRNTYRYKGWQGYGHWLGTGNSVGGISGQGKRSSAANQAATSEAAKTVPASTWQPSFDKAHWDRTRHAENAPLWQSMPSEARSDKDLTNTETYLTNTDKDLTNTDKADSGTAPLSHFPFSFPHFRLYGVVSVHMCVLPYKYHTPKAVTYH